MNTTARRLTILRLPHLLKTHNPWIQIMAVGLVLLIGFEQAAHAESFGMWAGPLDSAQVTDDPESPSTALRKGARIRIWSQKLQKNPQIAVVETVEDEQLILTMPNRSGLVRAAYEDLDRLEISVKPGRNNALKYALYGGCILGLSLLIISDSAHSARSDVDLRGFALGLGILAGGALGAVIGVAISSPEVWEEVPLPRSDGANYEPSEVKRVGIVLATF